MKVFISTFPFGRSNPRPLAILEQSGWEVITNPKSRKLSDEEVADYVRDCDALIAGTENLRLTVEKSASLRLIARVGVGLDSVPLQLCRDRGIRVTWTPNAVSRAVVEFTIGLMIDVMRGISFADRELRNGAWTRPYGMRIGESTIGIVGFGRIGSGVAQILGSFRPRQILVRDARDCGREIGLLAAAGVDIRQVQLTELLEKSDVVSLHVPLTRMTRNLISAEELKRMRPDAVLINTARGGIVDEAALLETLSQRRIRAAAVDVFEQEPYRGPLTELDNVVLTQHNASCAYDSREQMELEAAEEAVRWIQGQPPMNEVPDEQYAYQGE